MWRVDTPSSERVTTSSGAFMEKGRQAGSIRLLMASQVLRIAEDAVALRDAEGQELSLPQRRSVFHDWTARPRSTFLDAAAWKSTANGDRSVGCPWGSSC